MKRFRFAFLLFLFAYSVSAQNLNSLNQSNTDTPGRAISFQANEKYFLVTRGNISFYSSFPEKAGNVIENEIQILEGMECEAILKRDTVTLVKLWSKDFSNDGRPLNQVVPGKNALPYYVSFSRMIESLIVSDSTAYTRGIEQVFPLEIYKKLGEPVKRNFTHMWMKKYGSWKLVTKYISDIKE